MSEQKKHNILKNHNFAFWRVLIIAVLIDITASTKPIDIHRLGLSVCRKESNRKERNKELEICWEF